MAKRITRTAYRCGGVGCHNLLVQSRTGTPPRACSLRCHTTTLGTCSVSGCEDWVRVSGMCLRHYNAWRRTGSATGKPCRGCGETMPHSFNKYCDDCKQKEVDRKHAWATRTLMRDRTCECGRPVGPKGGHGLCRSCLERRKRAEFIALELPCEVAGCGRLRRTPSDPWCDMHRSRVRTHGEPGPPESQFRQYETKRINVTQLRHQLLAAQGGRCALCGCTETKKWHLDHVHADCCERGAKSGRRCMECVRGVLCHTCNIGLGMFGDDPAQLRAAATYIEDHKKRQLRLAI